MKRVGELRRPAKFRNRQRVLPPAKRRRYNDNIEDGRWATRGWAARQASSKQDIDLVALREIAQTQASSFRPEA